MELLARSSAGCGTPHWSPDGQRAAFEFVAEKNTDIYVIWASGGKPIRLTSDSADDTSPSWSRDGNWLYFGSNRTGRFQVWKVSAQGGESVQVTRNGGETAFESPDGKSIYYTKAFVSSGLWKQVLPSVVWRAYSLLNDGIYFIPEPGADGMSSIQFLSFATAKVKTVGLLSGPPREGLSVSPDGLSILYTQLDEASSDLMLVENFR